MSDYNLSLTVRTETGKKALALREGGQGGGQVVAEGTPEQLAREAKTPTGKYLKKYL